MPEEFIAPAKCNGCQQVFPSKHQAEEHARRAGHWSYQCITRICTQCSKTFAKNEDQQQHIKATGHMEGERRYIDVPAPVSVNGTRSHVCEDCKVQFTSADRLASHRRSAHTASSSVQGIVNPAISCPTCRAQFSSSTELVAHVTKTESCSTCKVCLQQGQTLGEHYWDSKKHPKCNPCVMGFENEVALAAHKKECRIAPTKPKPSNNTPSGKALGKAPMASKPINVGPNTVSVNAQPAINDPSSSHKPFGGAWTRKVNGADDGSLPVISPSAPTAPGHVASPASSSWGLPASAGTSSDGSPAPSARGTAESSGSRNFGPPALPASAWAATASAGLEDGDSDDAQAATAWVPQRSTGSDDVRSPSPANWASMLAPSADREHIDRSRLGARSSATSMFESARGSPSENEGSSLVESPGPTLSVAGEHDSFASTTPFSAVRSSDAQPSRSLNTPPKNDNLPKHSQPNAKPYSWHCRSCEQDLYDPVTTICGHLMCFECALREFRTNLGCPVCKKPFLVRLQFQ